MKGGIFYKKLKVELVNLDREISSTVTQTVPKSKTTHTWLLYFKNYSTVNIVT